MVAKTIAVEQMLEADEIAAIREAMGQVVAAPTANEVTSRDAQPIALIAEDRAVVQARPNGIKIGTRWARLAKKQIQRMTGAKVEIDLVGADSVEAASLRDELVSTWTGAIATADKNPLSLAVAVSGPMIETLAARFLGAVNAEEAGAERPPSAVALRLFQPLGDGLLRALAEAWQEEQGCAATVVDDLREIRTRQELLGSGIVLLVTLSVRGGASGQIRILSRPEALIAPAPRVEAVPAAVGQINETLGLITVEVSVELGRARVTMNELSMMRPGAVISLDRFVDDLLPIRCQGVIKAWGRAMVARNAMAVEVGETPKESEAG
jgi:flagellar motor switch protein FliM